MCLGVPAKIIEIKTEVDPLLSKGVVDFGGVQKEISLAYVPEVQIDNYVIVHVGFAISILNQKEAEKTLDLLESMGNDNEISK
jgi:hydrogenase expression/formation protein HypC